MSEHSNTQHLPPAYQDDEIDLFELWDNIWGQKWLVMGVTLISAVMGLIVAFSLTPVFQANAHFLPPQNKGIQVINHSILNKKYEVNEIYDRFIVNLESRALRRQFFDAKNMLAYYAKDDPSVDVNTIFFEQFHQNLRVTKPKRNEAEVIVSMSFELDNVEKSAEIINQFVSSVTAFTKQELIQEVSFEIENQLKELDEKIHGMRELAEQRRLDRVERLKEALTLAKATGIEMPTIEQAANQLNMEYMRGSLAIQTEIDVLISRESDDPFTPEIRNHQERIAYLKGISIDEDNLHVVRLDQKAFVPDSSIKPNKKLILAVSLVLGGMFGIFVALIRSAIRNRKKQLTLT